jgi:uncharacterized protein YcfJ
MRLRSVHLVVGLLATLAGCAPVNNTQAGMLWGGGIGTVAGAIIGHQSHHGGSGALIGAAAGALVGGLAGNAADVRNERDAAIAHAYYVQHSRPLLTNEDLIRLTQGGIGDDLILEMIDTRGGRFDLDADAIVQLKSSGVSDRVILRIQRSARPTYEGPPGFAPPTYYVTPVVGVGVGWGPAWGPAWGPRYYRRRCW